MITACLRHGTREGFQEPHKVLTWEESSLGKKPEGVGAAGDSPSPLQAWNAGLPRATTPSPHPLLQSPLGPMRGLGEGPGKAMMSLEGRAASLKERAGFGSHLRAQKHTGHLGWTHLCH